MCHPHPPITHSFLGGGVVSAGHVTRMVEFYDGIVWQTGSPYFNNHAYHTMTVFGAFMYAGM